MYLPGQVFYLMLFLACKYATCFPWHYPALLQVTCGIGERTRTRQCSTKLLEDCRGSNFEVKTCDAGPCPDWTSWSEWTRCSKTCGGGQMTRKRRCPSGMCEGQSLETLPCSLESCPVWSNWGPFSRCTISCGSGGLRTRERICLGGTDCKGKSKESRRCRDLAPCPEWSSWDDWSECSTTCGHGFMTRQRACLGGAYCPGDRAEERRCDHMPCSFWGMWKEWSPCTVTCGDGMKRRMRICQHGTDCRGADQETLFCFGPPCSAWMGWGDWTRCSSDCGPGQKNRQRQCVAADGSPSEDCIGLNSETVLCFDRQCCHWAEWGPYSACSRDCGTGMRHRERQCQRPNLAGQVDETCSCTGPDFQNDDCNTHPCYPLCQWTHWYQWSQCSSTHPCQAGFIVRRRQCVGEVGCECRGPIQETNECHKEGECAPQSTTPEPVISLLEEDIT